MKAIKFLSVACCIAAVSLTSCLSDSDSSDNSLTKADIAQCFAAVQGNHVGKLIYPAKNIKDVKDVTDTLDITWSVKTDSTMTIYDFPTRLLAINVDSVKGKDMKDAIMALPDQDLTCRIGFVSMNPIQFLINPVTPKFTVKMGDGNHDIQPAFYGNNLYSYGSYDYTKKEFYMQIIEGAIFLDGKETAYLTSATPFAFIETQKK